LRIINGSALHGTPYDSVPHAPLNGEKWESQFSGRRLSGGRTRLPQLAVLGLLSGVSDRVVILLFGQAIRMAAWVTFCQVIVSNLSRQTAHDHFADCWPLAGALTLGLMLASTLQFNDRKVGIVHVMERAEFIHRRYISLRSAIVQFVCGVLDVVSGQSAGPRGPAGCIGATFSKPDAANGDAATQQQQFVPGGCGCAAAISGLVHTRPFSGVILSP